MQDFLLLTSMWTLFGLNIYGFAFYPTYLLVLFYLFRKAILRVPRSLLIVIVTVTLLIGIPVMFRPRLLTDWMRWIFLVLLFIRVMTYSKNRIGRLYTVIDWSIGILVIYGIFQYLSVIFGFPERAAWLANIVHQFSGLSAGAPFDLRDNLRVASLTQEPSYFAFTVGIYFFITQRKLVKRLCIIGSIISFSQITIYATLGLLFYYVLRQMFRVKLLVFLLLIVAINLFFAKFLYEKLPEDVALRLYPRYVSLVWFAQKANPVEVIVGLSELPDSSDLGNIVGAPFQPNEIWVSRGLSNIGSLFVNFGLLGMVVYCACLAQLGRYNQYAALALFLYGFNFYYLTAWPSFVIFAYMIYLGGGPVFEDHNRRLVNSQYLNKLV